MMFKAVFILSLVCIRVSICVQGVYLEFDLELEFVLDKVGWEVTGLMGMFGVLVNGDGF